MIAYRYLEPEYADDAVHGRFLLRRLSHYRTIESPERRDNMEGLVGAHIDHQHYVGMVVPNSPEAIALRQLGIEVAEGASGITITNVMGLHQVADDFVLCLTARANEEMSSGGRTAILKIADVDKFAHQIAEASGFSSTTWGAVKYEPRVYDPRKEILQPDAFKKRVTFAHEQEIRILWKVRTAEAAIFTERFENDTIVQIR